MDTVCPFRIEQAKFDRLDIGVICHAMTIVISMVLIHLCLSTQLLPLKYNLLLKNIYIIFSWFPVFLYFNMTCPSVILLGSVSLVTQLTLLICKLFLQFWEFYLNDLFDNFLSSISTVLFEENLFFLLNLFQNSWFDFLNKCFFFNFLSLCFFGLVYLRISQLHFPLLLLRFLCLLSFKISENSFI